MTTGTTTHTGWHTQPLTAFDLETTAPNPVEARIVTAAIVRTGTTPGTHARTWLLNPGVPIPEGATAVHGITTEQAVADGMDAATGIAQIAQALADGWATGAPLVAFNASYDLTVLDRELRRHGQPGLKVTGPVIDPYVIDRHIDKYRKGKRTLSAQVEHYRVTLDGAHNATADAIGAARVAWRIATMYPAIAAMPLADLHAAQAEWHAERQADFAKYLAAMGKPTEDVNGEWPVRS